MGPRKVRPSGGIGDGGGVSAHAGSSGGRIVVVEDDPSIGEMLATGLGLAGHVVEVCTTGSGGLAAIEALRPDLVVLDVNLPDLDGFEICRRLRAAGDEVPVIFLTARQDAGDVRSGFAGGGDDYLTKPFRIDELTLRVGAVLRRARPSPRGEAPVVCGPVVHDPLADRIWVDGVEVHCTPTERRLLGYLLLNVGRTLTRTQIADHLWPFDPDRDEQLIETYVSGLRRKLEPPGVLRVLHTVRGIGYAARRPIAP